MSQLLELPAALAGVEPRRATYEFRARTRDDNGRLVLAGHASVFGEENSWGEIFVPGAYVESLQERNDRKPLVMGLYHREAIGRWTIHEERRVDDVFGLWLEGPISKTRGGEDAAVLVDDGALTGLSVGFWPLVYQFAEPNERVSFDTPYGRWEHVAPDFVVYIVKADVLEASLVMVPADDEARLARSRAAISKAHRALPGLSDGAKWADVAYSMALLMGGRGAAAFSDLPELERRRLHAQLERAYERHGKAAPEFELQPRWSDVQFRHDEREIFHDRYLRKQLDSVVAGCAGVAGALSPETRERAEKAHLAITDLLAPPRNEVDELRELAQLVRSTTRSLKGE
jgi:HK97 family phage prohead protease